MPTKIEWTDETWNPVTGCSKVSQGCKHCYALREWPRLAANPKATAYFGRDFTDVACHPERLGTPLRWTKPRKVFVNSMSDLFHEDVPFDFIDRVFAVMALSPQHIFQVLTKRPERMRDYMSFEGHGRWGFIDGRARQIFAAQHGRHFPPGKILLGPLPHVWLGVSVEDQATADQRIPLLLQTPAAVRWISAEPLLGAVDLTRLSIFKADTLSRHTDALRGHSWGQLPRPRSQTGQRQRAELVRAGSVELARRAQAKPPQNPKRWCEECANFVAWIDKKPPPGPDCPLDYNPCAKGHTMAFIAPQEIGDAYGFCRAVCPDRELIGAPICGAT